MRVFIQSKQVTSLRAEAVAIGMAVAARGDHELALFFDAIDERQVQFALRACRARRKRQVHLSEAQREELRERVAMARAARERGMLAGSIL
jgi:hypothetical protein